MNSDDVGVRYHKFMINALFGKQMENVFNYRDFRIVKDASKARQLNSKVNFHDAKKISNNVLLFEMTIISVLLNKPIQVGFTILEISKVIMHKIWMELKEIFGDRIMLMYTDTDSFKVNIESEDAYLEFKDYYRNKLDTSNIKKDTKLPYTPGLNRKIPLLLKDENGDNIMTGFRCTSSKTNP